PNFKSSSVLSRRPQRLRGESSCKNTHRGDAENAEGARRISKIRALPPLLIACFPSPIRRRARYGPKNAAARVFLFEIFLPGLPPGAVAQQRQFPYAECLPFRTRALPRAIIHESS